MKKADIPLNRETYLDKVLGCWAGIYQLPLGTAIQDRSPVEQRGRYLAAANTLDSLSMTAASILLAILNLCRVGARGVFAVVAALMLLVLPLLKSEKLGVRS